jgi:hypothetical protein
MISKMPPAVAGLLFLTGTTVILGGVATYNAGALRVSVDESRPGGDHVHLFVPAVVIPSAVDLIPEKELRKHAKQMQPWLPAIKIASRELSKSPDGILVEVIEPNQHVVISKQSGSILIDVKSPKENVHVTVPLRMIYSVAEKFEAAGPPV